MRFRKIGSSDLNISVIGFGTWAISGEFTGFVEEKTAISTINAALDNGINFIDTAHYYGWGRSEIITGKALKGRRDMVYIATKTGAQHVGKECAFNLKPENIKKEIEDSLRRLDMDYIDLYQIHWPDPDTPLEDSLDMLVKLRDQGKCRYIGVCNFKVDMLQQSINQAGIVSLQPHYSILNRKIEKEILPFCVEKSLGVLTWGSLGGGVLTGRFKEIPKDSEERGGKIYPYYKEPVWSKCQELVDIMRDIANEHNGAVSHVAINWILAQKGVTCALVGASAPKQAISNAKAADWELSDEDISRIDKKYNELFVH
jgi:aryl-alcohol dehydrogenase-like predicted oxidoreductase